MTDTTVLDLLLSAHTVSCAVEQVSVSEEALVHVFGTQEPVRDQPDDRARMLLKVGWLSVESVNAALPESERPARVLAVQQAARAWLQHRPQDTEAGIAQQVRWLVEKARPKESSQQIAQRVWLAIVLYGMGCRGLQFDIEGQIRWNDGIAGRIGLSPDGQLDLAWQYHTHTIYAASFRSPDGTIARGKGRNRWYVYRLTIATAADILPEWRRRLVNERVAVIVASDTHATQPQLPRDFYGGDEFQQACIDAQDGQFDHILVLSPEHGILSLDDIVPSDIDWADIMDHKLWLWQVLASNRLSAILLGVQDLPEKPAMDAQWWVWINPESVYTFTVFGGGFPVRLLFDHLLRIYNRLPRVWPTLALAEYRRGYTIDDFEDQYDLDEDLPDEDDELSDARAFEAAMQDINQLIDWGTEFVSLVSVHVPTTEVVWELDPDEAVIPMRILDDEGVDVDNLLDLLTDVSLLLEQPLPLTLIINPSILVSAMLQIAHGLVHDERDSIPQILGAFHENVLSQYVEKALQEPTLEDRLCACLSLAEQAQLIALTVPQHAAEQLLIWMQTFISVRMRLHLLGEDPL